MGVQPAVPRRVNRYRLARLFDAVDMMIAKESSPLAACGVFWNKTTDNLHRRNGVAGPANGGVEFLQHRVEFGPLQQSLARPHDPGVVRRFGIIADQ